MSTPTLERVKNLFRALIVFQLIFAVIILFSSSMAYEVSGALAICLLIISLSGVSGGILLFLSNKWGYRLLQFCWLGFVTLIFGVTLTMGEKLFASAANTYGAEVSYVVGGLIVSAIFIFANYKLKYTIISRSAGLKSF